VCITGTPNWALTVKTTVPISCTPSSLSANSQQSDALGLKSPNPRGVVMTATFKKTPILFAALLIVATPAFAGDWRTTPGGTDGCALYNQNLECMDNAQTFLASSANDGTIRRSG